jgi:putative nucleotidyltransferase with HDIG domain
MTTDLLETESQSPEPIADGAADPLVAFAGLISLRRLVGLYPSGHPVIGEKAREVHGCLHRLLQESSPLEIDVIRDEIHINGGRISSNGQVHARMVRELTDVGIHSIQITRGISADEIFQVADFLCHFDGAVGGPPVSERLAARSVSHVKLARIVSLDTRWRSRQWENSPPEPLDPDYAESLLRAEETFDRVASGREPDAGTVRDLVQLLIRRVARSNAALGQILAVKQYENLTYCHSVNVSMLSLLIGRRMGLNEAAIADLVEAALLHDIGKTRVPLEVVSKPGSLDKHERRLIEAHALYGAEILTGVRGLRPLTPTVALEHHRTANGLGYPDLGDGVVPHSMSQIVSVADVYEAITGARSYKEPTPPDRACLILARIAGDQLHTALVKAFVSTVSFFPIGSFVRTSRDELGLVVRTNPADALHPVVALLNAELDTVIAEVDTSSRDSNGAFERDVLETLPMPAHAIPLTQLLGGAPAES